MEYKKRISISLEEKLSILKDIEEGKKSKDICKVYKIHRSTFSRIKQDKENILNFSSETYINPKKIKRMKNIKYSEIDKLVYLWFFDQRQSNNLVSNDLLKFKAIEVNKILNGPESFMASDGWLSKFKKRHGIRILTVSGESLSCSVEISNSFIKEFQKIIHENELMPDQIYNCDESGLIYKALHKKTNVTIFEKYAAGRKAMKERVTIMPCVNASGRHKLELMMIGKSKSPRCFKNIKLPLYYKSSKNAWQTCSLFKDWYYNLFIPQVTSYLESRNLPIKALLLVDNATCHGNEKMFNENPNFRVVFFPPNNTPLLQPLDQHVLKSLKQRYRKHLLTSLAALGANDGMISALKNINLKDVVYLIVQAWEEISVSIIEKSFSHLFPSVVAINNNATDDRALEEDNLTLPRLYRSILNDSTLNENDIMEWANGLNETHVSFESEQIQESVNEMIPEEELYVDDSNDINDVISSFNMVLQWAVENDMSSNEIITLQRMREQAVIKKYNSFE